MWSIARRLSSSHEDAEDAVQEVLLDIWKNAARFDRSQGSETTFIAMLGRRRCIDRLRKQGRRLSAAPLEPESPEPAGRESTTRVVDERDEIELVRGYLSSLRPEQQTILNLSVELGLTHSEIATRLELPLGTVKTHLRRALIEIRRQVTVGRASHATTGSKGESQ